MTPTMTSTLHDIDTAAIVSSGDLDISGLAPLHPTLPHAVVFTLPTCPNCERLKLRFNGKSIPLIAVSMIDNDVAREVLVNQLGLQSTPITVVYNTFVDPVYFIQADIERSRRALDAITERLAGLYADGSLTDTGAYLDELVENTTAEPGKKPALDPAVFADLATAHMPTGTPQPRPVTAADLVALSSVKGAHEVLR